MPQKVRCWKKVIQVALYMRIILVDKKRNTYWVGESWRKQTTLHITHNDAQPFSILYY